MVSFFEDVKEIQDLISRVSRNTEKIDDWTSQMLNWTTKREEQNAQEEMDKRILSNNKDLQE